MRSCRVIVALGVAVSAGCGVVESGGYEASLRYPARRDPVVVRIPSVEPTVYPPTGGRDDSILRLPTVGGELVFPGDALSSDVAALADMLGELFGTPAAPSVPAVTADCGFDLSAVTLAAGSRLYGQKCANCHGYSGDGRGPVGPLTTPYPRDFRAGVFKVAVGGHKPTPDQLAGLLRRGVPGSAMPIYDLLPDSDVRALSAYVVHLSVRGEAEVAGLRAAAEGDDPAAAARTKATTALAAWAEPQSATPSVATLALGELGYADAVRRGRDLFRSPAAGCASCHQDYGRTEAFRYDVWGSPVRVSDLTRGEFRWGRDDATLAARIRHGIPAAGMPASPHLTDAQVGDLVTFVRDLGSPARLPPDVRAEIYPQTATR